MSVFPPVYATEKVMRQSATTDNILEEEKRTGGSSKSNYKLNDDGKSLRKFEALPNGNNSKKIKHSSIKSGTTDVKRLFKFSSSNDENDIDDILNM